MSLDYSTLGEQSRIIRGGYHRTHEREHNEAIFTTSSFVFDSAQQASDLFSGEQDGNVYSRFTNPTVRAFEERLALMEGAKHCIGFSSGMAAITTMVLGLLKSGDHIVASSSLFGSTVTLFSKICTRFGIEVTFVDLTNLEAWQTAINSNTKLFYLETPSNPLCEIGDILAISQVAHEAGILLAVDNAFCTPILQKPMELGADIVVHTATKYLDGQGRCVGGALLVNDDDLYDDLFACLRSTGACMSPFNAWVFSKGLETLKLRMLAQTDNAIRIAVALNKHPGVEKVYYPGLVNHPQYQLANEQLKAPGAIVSFEVKGERESAWKVIDSTRMLSITANLGDTKTTITHPASTTHARISQAQRDEAGIRESLIRLSVGLEESEDVLNDLYRGLDSID